DSEVPASKAWWRASRLRRLVDGRVDDLISGLEPDRFSRAAVHLEYALYGPFRRDELSREGLGMALDPVHFPVCADEDHVEGNDGIAHPHLACLRPVVEEQHAGIPRHSPPIHETERHLPGGRGNVNGHR